MLETFLIRLVARIGVPERFRRVAGYIGLALAVVAMLGAVKWFYDRSVIADHEAKQDVAVLKADAGADDIAGQVAASEAATVEGRNNEARKASIGSPDPLGDGLRALKKK